MSYGSFIENISDQRDIFENAIEASVRKQSMRSLWTTATLLQEPLQPRAFASGATARSF